MRYSIVILFLSAAFTLHAQDKTTIDTGYNISTAAIDSLTAMQRKIDSINTANSINRMNENTTRWLAERSRENDRKATQGMWIRLSLGIGFLIIGIIGIARKKKSKAGNANTQA